MKKVLMVSVVLFLIISSLVGCRTNTKTSSEKTSPKDSKAVGNRYAVAGIDNAKEFEKTFNIIKALVTKGDKVKLAEYINYPIQTYVGESKTTISNSQQFIDNYDKIFTSKVKNSMNNQKVEDTFVNDLGVMVGTGEIWLNKVPSSKNIYKIFFINNN